MVGYGDGDLLVCLVLDGNNLLNTLHLGGLSSGSRDRAASNEAVDSAAKLLCRGECAQRASVQLATALLKDGQRRQKAAAIARAADGRRGPPQQDPSGGKKHGVCAGGGWASSEG